MMAASGDRVATLKYLDPAGAVEEFPHRNLMHERTIRDGREVPALLSESGATLMDQLDSFGFGLWPAPCSDVGLSELRDPEALRVRYAPRLLDWLRHETGAAHAAYVNQVLRRSLPGRASAADRDAMSRNHFVPRDQGEWTGAIDGVHSDYSDDSALLQLARSVQIKEEGLRGGRWVAINCWRNVAETGAAVPCWPLALCDGRTVEATHLSPRETPENRNWVLNALPEGEHAWYWFPAMTTDEMVVFKSWDESAAPLADHSDSAERPILERIAADAGRRSKCVLHTGFADMLSAEDAPARESLEIRVLLFWPPSPSQHTVTRPTPEAAKL
jgi:hypothetical protein